MPSQSSLTVDATARRAVVDLPDCGFVADVERVWRRRDARVGRAEEVVDDVQDDIEQAIFLGLWIIANTTAAAAATAAGRATAIIIIVTRREPKRFSCHAEDTRKELPYITEQSALLRLAVFPVASTVGTAAATVRAALARPWAPSL